MDFLFLLTNVFVGNVLKGVVSINFDKFVSVLERPSSQMSYFDQFIKESSTRHGGSVESEEGDIEDNRAPSLTSSKSNLSELSIVSFHLNIFWRLGAIEKLKILL